MIISFLDYKYIANATDAIQIIYSFKIGDKDLVQERKVQLSGHVSRSEFNICPINTYSKLTTKGVSFFAKILFKYLVEDMKEYRCSNLNTPLELNLSNTSNIVHYSISLLDNPKGYKLELS